jgi:heptosyltransferase-3
LFNFYNAAEREREWLLLASLLIIHQGALGDFILTFPAIACLQKYYQRIDVLCQSQLGRLAAELRLVKNWYPSEAAYVASLFSDQIDPQIKVLLEPYAHIILFTFSDQLEATLRQVSAVPCCRMAPRPPVHERIHVTKFILENLVNCCLIDSKDAELALIRPAGKRLAAAPRKILLHPGAGSPRKRWPLSSFLDVAARLKANGLRPEFILGPAEEDLVDRLRRPARSVHVLDDLLDLTVLLKSAGGYIGNDSGASHLAAFLGLPSTVIFGPADPERWKPLGCAVEVVRPALGCRPCFETEGVNCPDPGCLNDIQPEMVIDAFYRVYKKTE